MAHIKASTLGNNFTIPISKGQFNIGIWQGIYPGEHRNHGGKRPLVTTIQGEGQ
ncbi:YjbQ family protein [Thalassomonas actiniarum]|uniref:YjbQ family protein n=1 Tax=Thalassomonas actiniarum TaxID=485447 RepID=A0AAF0C2C9_9GAMM|nr:YjbQ family protein [Thalassomonas actiniarum]